MKHQTAGRRGSALILALIAVLVLAIVGIGLAYLSSTEDRISGNDKLQKEGFYAAEAGLRAGEAALATQMASTSAISTLLQNGGADSLDLHDGGYTANLFGTYKDVKVNFTTSDTRDVPYYTLYIRNNSEDASAKATTDTDLTLNLVAVGYVMLPGGQRITKILEEQISNQSGSGAFMLQKEGNSGGTGGL